MNVAAIKPTEILVAIDGGYHGIDPASGIDCVLPLGVCLFHYWPNICALQRIASMANCALYFGKLAAGLACFGTDAPGFARHLASL